MPNAVLAPVTPDSIAQAASLLQEGRLVAFPTETVYGLGANALDDKAVAAVFAAKGRPNFNPLIVHVHAASALDQLVVWNDTARLLAEHFWPGPLTLVLPRAPECSVSLLASAGLDTLAVRVPSHPVAQRLLAEACLPIAAPSANRSGSLSPTTPIHVAESLGDKVDMILAGGKCAVGVESTVLDLSGAMPTLLRPGAITREMLEPLIGKVATGLDSSEQPKSPGQLLSHYAPDLPLRMNAMAAEKDESYLTFGPDMGLHGGALRLNLSESGDLEEAAANLFAYLRQLDKPGLKGIAVAPIPETGLGIAINDRLRRAAAPRS